MSGDCIRQHGTTGTNRAKVFGTAPDVRMSYEKALRNLIVFMFGYYIDALECHGARKGHQAILALECFRVADQLGRFHCWYKRMDLWKPSIMKTQWKELPHKPQDDCYSPIIPRWLPWVALCNPPKGTQSCSVGTTTTCTTKAETLVS